MKLTQAEAARAAGVSRTHILRAIKSGKISAEKLEDGGIRIDGSELLRVWPQADLKRARNSGNSHGNSVGNSQGDTGNSVSQALLDEIRQDRDRLREELRQERQEREQERQRFMRLLEQQGEQMKLLTDQRERRPWWQFWS